jgi:hypothetical protein
VIALHNTRRRALLRRGVALEYTTLGWNVAGIIVLGYAAISARSVALAGFALDSLIEIGASAEPIAVIGFTIVGDRIAALNLIADQGKLRHLTIQP